MMNHRSDSSPMRGILLAATCSILLTVNASAQESLDSTIQQAIVNHKKTLEEAQRYTYIEHKRDRTFDSAGNVKHYSTDTYEILFLEGAPYQKHIRHNDQPLSDKEQKAEDKKLADVAKARRNSKDKILSGHFHLQLPVDQIPTRFDVVTEGSGGIDGRTMMIFTARPRGGMEELSHDGLAYEMKLWVDVQDNVFAKIEARVIAEGMRFENGSLLGYNWKKVNNEVWLPDRYWYKGKVRYMMMNVPVETEQTYTDYQKFHADTKIIPQ